MFTTDVPFTLLKFPRNSRCSNTLKGVIRMYYQGFPCLYMYTHVQCSEIMLTLNIVGSIHFDDSLLPVFICVNMRAKSPHPTFREAISQHEIFYGI